MFSICIQPDGRVIGTTWEPTLRDGWIAVSDADAKVWFDFYPNLWYIDGAFTNESPTVKSNLAAINGLLVTATVPQEIADQITEHLGAIVG